MRLCVSDPASVYAQEGSGSHSAKAYSARVPARTRRLGSILAVDYLFLFVSSSSSGIHCDCDKCHFLGGLTASQSESQPSSEDLVADLLQRLSSPCVISNRRPDLQARTVSSANLNGRFPASLDRYHVLVSGRPCRRVPSSRSKRTGYVYSLRPRN